ncbi:MAG: hypothetical protein L7U87_09010 [Chlamydiales bacterium]|nr:hypothetical protein [Chlamydiales bacterium]
MKYLRFRWLILTFIPLLLFAQPTHKLSKSFVIAPVHELAKEKWQCVTKKNDKGEALSKYVPLGANKVELSESFTYQLIAQMPDLKELHQAIVGVLQKGLTEGVRVLSQVIYTADNEIIFEWAVIYPKDKVYIDDTRDLYGWTKLARFEEQNYTGIIVYATNKLKEVELLRAKWLPALQGKTLLLEEVEE